VITLTAAIVIMANVISYFKHFNFKGPKDFHKKYFIDATVRLMLSKVTGPKVTTIRAFHCTFKMQRRK